MSTDTATTPADAETLPFRYNATLAGAIERRWQDYWEHEGTFHVPNPAGPWAAPMPAGEKVYLLDMFPYPSGSGLHVGHPLGFIGTDVLGRYLRMTGRTVLHTMGFDAFGLPAEQYAVQTGTHPRKTTEENILRYKSQLRQLGLAHDQRRSVATTDVEFYRWTQWIFLQIYNSWYDGSAGPPDRRAGGGVRRRVRAPTPDGRPWAELTDGQQRRLIDSHRLAYISEAPVNWCPGLGTVLANEEVTADGRSDRGNFPVFRRNLKQWMMRITAYADRLVADLDRLDWPDSVKAMQRNWIGRSRGRAGPVPRRRHRDRGVHHPPGHPVRRHLHGAGPRAPAGRRHRDGRVAVRRRRALDGRRARPRHGDRGVPRGGVPQDRPGPPGEQGQDRRLHRRLRHQPGQRQRDPGVRRRLRADGLRHRRDHGRARAGPARLGLRGRRSACRSSARSSPRPGSRARRTPARARRSTPRTPRSA